MMLKILFEKVNGNSGENLSRGKLHKKNNNAYDYSYVFI